jgi:LPPG:FO 2-phospho-L-lactate transferase
VAITPIVAGASLKGPTVEMMRAVGPPPTPVEVARMYREIASTFVLDSRDRELAAPLDEMGYRTLVLDTVMSDGGGALAARILEVFT